jgi:toxin YoeB
MAAAKRRALAPAQPPAVPDQERQAILHRDFRRDLTHWIGSQPRIALRIMRLMEEILRDPMGGVGRPEALKHDMSGNMSRRITDEDRLVYIVSHTAVLFLVARWHYGRR